MAVTNQHAARTRPAVSGIGERRVCSTCSRLLVEPRRDPASMCTQVLATGSSALFRPFRLGGQAFATRVVAARPYAARNCEGWRVAGAGGVVKRARRAGKRWAAPAPAESHRSEQQQRGVSTSPRPARLGEGRDPSSQQGEARTISPENAPPRLYTVPPHSLFAILMNLNKGYALYGGLQTYGLNLKQPCKAIRNQL